MGMGGVPQGLEAAVQSGEFPVGLLQEREAGPGGQDATLQVLFEVFATGEDLGDALPELLYFLVGVHGLPG